MLFPQINSARTVTDLSGVWNFSLGSDSLDTSLLTDSFAALPCCEQMAVPGSYSEQKEGLKYRDHYGYVYYQKSFTLPRLLKDERIVLHFGSVTHSCVVFLNGEEIGRHQGGFLPFELDISDKVRCDRENLLSLAVDNRINFGTLPVGNEQSVAMFGADLPDFESVRKTKVAKKNYPNFDFFNFSGIHRPVRLCTMPRRYIDDIAVTVDLPASHTEATVHYSVSVCGISAEEAAMLPVQVKILDEAGQVQASGRALSGSLFLQHPVLWQPGKGYLYTLQVVCGDDTYSQTFGVRSVKVEGCKFLINDEPFYFKGFGKHEDAPFTGKGLNNALNVKDISLMQWIHANSFRTSHYPYAEEMMQLCDREGIVVIDETPAVGLNFPNIKQDWYKDLSRTASVHRQVIRDMIARDKNHPCVVMWSIANEPDSSTRADSAHDYFMPLYELAHEVDPQDRPVTCVVCNNDYTHDKVAPFMDVICLNRYYGWYIFGGDLDAGAQAFEHDLSFFRQFNKPVMMTEYGADSVAGLHQVTPGMFSEEYQMEYYKVMNAVLDKLDFITGEQVWAFADFATIQGLFRVDGNKKGIFTRDRRPKLVAHYLKERWAAR